MTIPKKTTGTRYHCTWRATYQVMRPKLQENVNLPAMHLGRRSRRGREELFAHELSFSVDHANSAVEEVTMKFNSLISLNRNECKESIEELLVCGKLIRKTNLYYYTSTLLSQKDNRDMFHAMADADEKLS